MNLVFRYGRWLMPLICFFLVIVQANAQQRIAEDSVQSKHITGLCFSKDSEELLIIGTDNVFNRYSRTTRSLTPVKLNFKVNSAKSIALSENGKVALQNEDEVNYVDLSKASIEFGRTESTRKTISSFDFLPKQDILLYNDGSKLLQWDMTNASGIEIYQDGYGRIIKKIVPLHQKAEIIIVYADESIDIINYSTRKYIKSIPSGFALISAIDISSDDHYLAIGNSEGQIHIWDLTSDQKVWTGTVHTNKISAIRFSPFQNYLYCRSYDHSASMIRVPDGKEFFRIQLDPSIYPVMSLSKDGNLLAVNKSNKYIRIYKVNELISDSLLAEAERLMKRKSFPDAKSRINEALENTISGKAWQLRGEANRALGYADSALSDFQRAIRLSYNIRENRLNRAKLLFNKKAYRDVLADVDPVLESQPSDTTALMLKVNSLVKLEEYDKAGVVCEKALSLVKDNAGIVDSYIKILFFKKDYTKALPLIENLISQSPADPLLYFKRGQCYYFLSRFDKATQDLLLNTKNMNPDPELTRFRAFAAFTDEDYEKAEAYFRESLLTDPRNTDCLNGQALCLMAGNKQDELNALLKDRLPDSINTQNRLFINAINAVLCRKTDQVPELLKTIYTQNPGYTFSLGNALRFNQNQPNQRLYYGLFNCLSATIQSKKPEFPIKIINESQADYNIRWQKAKQELLLILEECYQQYNQNIAKIIADSKTTISQSVGTSIEPWDKQSTRLFFRFENSRFYIDKMDENKYIGIRNEGAAVMIKGYKQLAHDMVSWTYSDIQLVVPYFIEPLKATEFVSKPALAATPQTSQSTPDNTIANRGTRPVGPTNTSAPVEKSYKNFLLLIAVDEYEHWPPLRTAVNDVKCFSKVLLNQYRSFDTSNVITLTNKQVTRSNIINTLKQLIPLVGENDRLIIYYAGHGDVDPLTNDGYWVPYDAEKGGQADYLGYSQLRSILNAFKSLHIVLINDACYAGLISTKQRSAEDYISRKENFKSRVVLASGMHDETVSDQLKFSDNSPFAHYLIDYLKYNEDPSLSIFQIADHIQNAVSEITKNAQNPDYSVLPDSDDQKGQFYFHLKK